MKREFKSAKTDVTRPKPCEGKLAAEIHQNLLDPSFFDEANVRNFQSHSYGVHVSRNEKETLSVVTVPRRKYPIMSSPEGQRTIRIVCFVRNCSSCVKVSKTKFTRMLSDPFCDWRGLQAPFDLSSSIMRRFSEPRFRAHFESTVGVECPTITKVHLCCSPMRRAMQTAHIMGVGFEAWNRSQHGLKGAVTVQNQISRWPFVMEEASPFDRMSAALERSSSANFTTEKVSTNSAAYLDNFYNIKRQKGDPEIKIAGQEIWKTQKHIMTDSSRQHLNLMDNLSHLMKCDPSKSGRFCPDADTLTVVVSHGGFMRNTLLRGSQLDARGTLGRKVKVTPHPKNSEAYIVVYVTPTSPSEPTVAVLIDVLNSEGQAPGRLAGSVPNLDAGFQCALSSVTEIPLSPKPATRR
jgi:hypothetical protein